MSPRENAENGRSLPLVAVLSSVPMLAEALNDVMDGIAEVRLFPAGRDTGGLLRWLEPDAVVVDSDDEAEAAAEFGRAEGRPVVHVSYPEERIRVVGEGGWEDLEEPGISPELLRNVLAAGLFRRKEAHTR